MAAKKSRFCCLRPAANSLISGLNLHGAAGYSGGLPVFFAVLRKFN